ncbi:MAG: sulfotransferase [Campylobacterota bacterium]
MLEPIYISGLYRSGTKLLTSLLDQCDTVKTTYDTVHFMRFSYNKYLPIELNYKKLVRDTHARILKRWGMNFDVEKTLKIISSQNDITQAKVYDAIMRQFLNLENNIRWAEKTNVEWEGIEGFLDMFKNGKVIHIYRDPRAVLASYKYMTIHEGLKYLDAIFASLAMFNYISQEKILKNQNILLLKYEDFVKNPRQNTIKICDFLEIKFTEKMLDVTSFKDKFGNNFDTDSSFTPQKKAIDTSSVNLWQEKLSVVEIYFTELILKKQMEAFSYKPLSVVLTNKESEEFNKLLKDPFIAKRYNYFIKYEDGQQAYPNTKDAYSDERF